MKNYYLILICILAFACKKESDPVIPELQLTGTEVTEGNTGNTKATVGLNLNKATTNEVTVTVFTEDASAKAGEDYIEVPNTTVTFAPGETSKKVEVLIINDDVMDFTRKFQVKVENIKNATSKYSSANVTIADNDTYSPQSDADGVITPDNYPKMSLVWSDEFNDAQLNTNFWTCEKGAGGWGNNELQTYTDALSNVNLQNGRLNITGVKDGNGSFTSARIITKGKKEFKYGRIDIRAKLPFGRGIWPALWMLGGNISTVNWPVCGEIDIMEYLGHETNKVYGTAHYDMGGHKYDGGFYALDGDFSQKFHVFTLMWQENSLVWYVDYQKYFQFTKTGDPFNSDFFFIMNLAIGGNWPGNPDNTTVFPQTMVVDYVRVFQ